MGDIRVFPILAAASPSTVRNVLSHQASKLVLTFSLTGQEAEQVAQKISERMFDHHIPDTASFFSFLNRIIELVEPLEAEVSAMMVFEGRVALASYNGEVWLKRGSKVGRVLTSADELKMVEGSGNIGDMYICLTRSAAAATIEVLAQSFSQIQYNSEVEVIIPPLVMTLNGSGLASRSAIGVVVIEPDGSGFTPPEPVEAQAKKKRVTLPSSALKTAFLPKAVQAKLAGVVSRVKQKPSKKAARKLTFALLFFLMVVAGVIGHRIWQSTQISRANAFIAPFATQLSNIQRTEAQNNIAARDKMSQLLRDFDAQKVEVEKYPAARKTVQAFRDSAQEYLDSVSGKVELELLPTYYDFRLVRSDFIASRVDVDQGVAIFLDADKQIAISLRLDSKQQKLLPVGQYTFLKYISYFDEKLYLLSDGVYSFRIDSEQPAQKIIDEGDSNQDGKFLGVFNDFLYVFNAEKRNIYRYLLKEGEISEPIGWFQDKKDLDFSSVNSMAIDGNIWLSTSQGQILKFERGVRVSYEVKGLLDPFSNQIKIFTKENLDSVYVLDADKQRVVQLSKDGIFVKEIKSPLLAAATDVIFSEVTGKGYAVAGTLVYELSL